MGIAIENGFSKLKNAHPCLAYVLATVLLPLGLILAVGAVICCTVLPVSWILGLL